MFGIRAAIPATSRLNVIKYANLASLLQTNELLGNYRNLFWFGSPIGCRSSSGRRRLCMAGF